jgi:hypothetical protein
MVSQRIKTDHQNERNKYLDENTEMIDVDGIHIKEAKEYGDIQKIKEDE